MRTIVFVVAGVLLLWSGSGLGETGPVKTASGEVSLKQLRAALSTRLEEIQAPLMEFDEIYRGHLDQLSKTCQSQGELERVLMVKEELESLADERNRDYASFPRLQEMRRVYEEKHSEITNSVQAQRAEALHAYLQRLAAFKKKLTQDGQVDEALSVAGEEERAEALLSMSTSKKKPAKFFANCDNEYTVALDGKVIAHGLDAEVTPVELELEKGDILVAKVVDTGRKKGFACVIKREAAEPIASNRGTWRSYTPRDEEEWMIVDESDSTHLSDSASNQLWKANVEAASGVSCEAVWPRGNESVGYLLLKIED